MPAKVSATKKKLSDQMGFSGREIARRLHLIDFTEKDRFQLVSAKEVVLSNLAALIEKFYIYQLEDPEISDVIGDVDTLTRLKSFMSEYVQSIFDGDYDTEYVNTRLRIGKVHKRLDVRPKLYMKTHAYLQALLDSEIEAGDFGDDEELIKSALHKILLFDAELIFDAYVEAYLTEMQNATREVEKYASQVGIKLDSMFARLHDKTQKDSVTGLHNRRALFDYLKRECQVAERHGLSFVVIYMDLNNFKSVNDQHGHQAGDEVLAQVGNTLLSTTREVDIPVRYGGDEFCIIMPRTTLAEIEVPLSRITHHFDGRCPYPVTFSMGIIQVGPTVFEEPEELISKADQMMYQAKQRAHQDGQHHWQFEGKSKGPVNK